MKGDLRMSITNYPDADFTPDIPNSGANTGKQSYNPTGSFRFWAQKVLPTVYDDSLSYYEILTKVVNYLNSVIQNVDSLNDSVDNTNSAFDTLQGYVNTTKDTIVSAYNELQDYVNTYFDSLDVQEEINAKLDSMASDGSLSSVVSPFIPSAVSDWLSENITPTSPAIDASLSVSGAAADAKVTGELIRANTSDYYALTDYLKSEVISVRNIITETEWKYIPIFNSIPLTKDILYRFTVVRSTAVNGGYLRFYNADTNDLLVTRNMATNETYTTTYRPSDDIKCRIEIGVGDANVVVNAQYGYANGRIENVERDVRGLYLGVNQYTGVIGLDMGAFSTSDGVTIDITNARIKNTVPFVIDGYAKITLPERYNFWWYALDKTYTKISASTQWGSNTIDLTNKPSETYAINFAIRDSENPIGDISDQLDTVRRAITAVKKETVDVNEFCYKYNLKFGNGKIDASGLPDGSGNSWYLIAFGAIRGAKKIITNNYYDSANISTIAFYGESNTDVLAYYVKPESRIFDVPKGAKYFAVTSNVDNYQNVVVAADRFDGIKANIEANELCYINGRIMETYNPYHNRHSNQYMGQLHAHSYGHGSSSGDTEQSRIDFYNALVTIGYDFGTITNYNKITPNPVPNGNLIWLFNGCEQGYDGQGLGGEEVPHHIVMWNTPTGQSGDERRNPYSSPFCTVQDVLNIYDHVSMLSLAHPQWTSSLIDENKAKSICGLRYVETFSGNVGDPSTYGTDWTGNIDDGWNMLLTNGNICFATASADAHEAADPLLYLGNIKVFAQTKDRMSIYNALCEGNFYATSRVSVKIENVSFSDGVYTVNTGDINAKTYFYGANRELLSTVTGESASYTLTGAEKFVYAKVVFPEENNQEKYVAFTQPVFVLGVKN